MKDRILKVMEETFEMEGLDGTVSQKNCEAWDSLRHLQLIMALEEEFGISFEPEEISRMVDFAAVEEIIRQKG